METITVFNNVSKFQKQNTEWRKGNNTYTRIPFIQVSKFAILN